MDSITGSASMEIIKNKIPGNNNLLNSGSSKIHPKSNQESKDSLKVALIGTAMVRSEPIKEKSYYKEKIQKKIIAPPIGVYRLEYFLHQTFIKEIKNRELVVDVFSPNLLIVNGTINRLYEKIHSRKYNIIGFSPIRFQLGEDLYFMDRVHKEALKSGLHPLFIAGGNEASNNSESLLKILTWMDFCVYGLGEPVLQDIVKKFFEIKTKVNNFKFKKNDFCDIPGLIYYDNKKSKLISNPRNVSHAEIKKYSNYTPINIPYEDYWNLQDSENNPKGFKQPRVIRIFMSNYCPHQCAFCSDHIIGRIVFGKNITLVEPEELFSIIRKLYNEKKAEGIYFNDDDMLVNKDRAIKILEGLIKMKKNGEIPENFKFYGQARVDSVDEKTLLLLKKAGFVYFAFGVESFCQKSLESPDLNKGLNAKNSYNIIKSFLKKRIPVTNMNLMLFHPTITKESLVITAEKSLELLFESLKYGSKLSINSFPIIEAYAGAPINQIAVKNKWSKVLRNIEYDGKVFEYIESYLPVDNEIRKICKNNEILNELHRVMKELSDDSRWPGTTVSRSIGINALAMHIAAYRLLHIDEKYSSISINDMKEMIWKLIKKFHYIEEAAKILSAQNSYILFTKINNKFVFVKGKNILKGIDPSITKKIGNKCSIEVLIDAKNTSFWDIDQALREYLYGNAKCLEEALLKYHIPAYNWSRFKNKINGYLSNKFNFRPFYLEYPYKRLNIEIECNLCKSKNIYLLFKKQFNGLNENIVRCNTCGLIFVNPFLENKEIKDMYSEDYFKNSVSQTLGYKDYLSDKEKYLMDIRKILIPYLNKFTNNKGKILDIGCAFGYFLNEVKNNGWDPYGVDISLYAVKKAKELFNMNIFHGTVEEANFNDKEFKVITIFNVLGHVKDPLNLLKEVNRILDDNGLLIIRTSNLDSFEALLQKENFYLIKEDHLHYFSPATMKKILEKAGFSILHIISDSQLFDGFLEQKKIDMINRLNLGAHFKIAARKIK